MEGSYDPDDPYKNLPKAVREQLGSSDWEQPSESVKPVDLSRDPNQEVDSSALSGENRPGPDKPVHEYPTVESTPTQERSGE